MTSNTVRQDTQEPPVWYDAYRESYLSAEAHLFLLYGDIHGYAFQATTNRGFLVSQLAGRREVVLCYDRARGITFPDPTMREQALAMLRSEKEDERNKQPVSQTSSFDAALASLGTGETPDEEEVNPFSVRKPLAALTIIEQLLRTTQGNKQVAVIFDYAESLVPPTPLSSMSAEALDVLITLQTWAHDASLGNCNNPIFLLTRSMSDIHPSLLTGSSGVKAIEIPLPTQQARLTYLQWYLADRQDRGKDILLLDLTVSELARLSAGLSLRHLEDILLLGARAGGVSRKLLKGRKDAIIKTEFSEVAEMIEPLPGGFAALGGMEQIIQWARLELIAPLAAGNPEDAVKGALLAGPPGTGKTYFVQGLASEIGFNAVALNIENILGSLVGESEKKLKAFFAFCRALAPVLVFIDEIDQSDMSRRGNSSGNPVAANLFSALLRFMSDESLRGQVIMLFATNRPDLIDSALTRFGRIDAIIPFLLPKQHSRLGIIQAQVQAQKTTISEEGAQLIAEQTNKYSAADLAAVITKARKLARLRGLDAIDTDAASRALQLIKPASPQTADWYELLAISACNDASLLPQEEASLMDNRRELQQKIKAAKPDQSAPRREERTE